MQAPASYSPVLRLPANRLGRDFVVGDLHGCPTPLYRLLHKVKFDHETDRLISVGDLIDRGPSSVDTLRLLRQPWFYAVIGNHEAMLQSYLGTAHWKEHRGPDFLHNGGNWILGVPPHSDVIPEIRELVSWLPLVIEVGEGAARYRVVHAEIPSRVLSDGEIAEPDLVWCRDSVVWSRSAVSQAAKHLSAVKGFRLADAGQHSVESTLTISGHSVVDRPVYFRNQLFIDTGSYYRCGEHEPTVGLTMVNPSQFKAGLARGLVSPRALGFVRDSGYVPDPPRNKG